MKTIIHVNQHNIRANSKGKNLPVITCKTYKSNQYANEAIIYGQDGLVAADYRTNIITLTKDEALKVIESLQKMIE